MLQSKSDAGTSITQVTWDLNHNEIDIPAGKGGVLRRVEVQLCPVRTTIVNSGGLLRLRNSSADWDPFYFVSMIDTVVTEGGDIQGAPIVYEVSKELPGNSTVYSDYIPYSAETQHIKLTLVWELGAKLSPAPVGANETGVGLIMGQNCETFSGYIHPLKAAAVAATTRASPGNYQVPGGKGGRLVYLVDQVWPTVATVVNSGGLRELFNDSYQMDPCQKYTQYHTVTGASGGGVGRPTITPWDGPCPANSTFTSYYTPTNAQSQSLSTLMFWNCAVRKTVA